MPSTVFDSGIFRDLFGTSAMRAVFADEALAKMAAVTRSASRPRLAGTAGTRGEKSR